MSRGPTTRCVSSIPGGAEIVSGAIPLHAGEFATSDASCLDALTCWKRGEGETEGNAGILSL